MAEFVLGTSTNQNMGGAGTPSLNNIFFAEVMDIILSETHPKYEDLGSLGKIFFSPIRQSATNTTSNFALPINPNFVLYPMIGEIVLIITLRSDSFYMSTVNMLNDLNNNIYKGILTTAVPVKKISTEPDEYKELDITKQPVSQKEKNKSNDTYQKDYIGAVSKQKEIIAGSFVVASRFNSVMILGSEKNFNNPYIHLFNDGNNIAEAGSGIVVSKDDKDPNYNYTTKDKPHNFSINKKSSFLGNQIFITTDRLILNSQKNQMYLFSNLEMYLNSNTQIILESDKDIQFKSKKIKVIGEEISLGDAANQPAVLGNELYSALKSLINTIKQLSFVVTTPAGPGSTTMIPPNVANLNMILTSLNKIKSKVVKVK